MNLMYNSSINIPNVINLCFLAHKFFQSSLVRLNIDVKDHLCFKTFQQFCAETVHQQNGLKSIGAQNFQSKSYDKFRLLNF